MQNRTIIDQTRPDQTRPDQTRPDHDVCQKTERNSSLELLRIIAMLMIVGNHFSFYGSFNFPENVVTLNRLWKQFIYMGGNIGNNIFVMLSGYFLINSKGLNFRRIFNLWIIIFFYSVVIYMLFMISGLEVFSLKTALKVLMPVTRNRWWFASAYFVMYLIHPYVNRLLNSFTCGEYKSFLLTIGIYWCIIPTLTNSDFGANNTINFVCLYSLAGYVRLYSDDFKERNYIVWSLVFIGLNFLSVIVIDLIGVKIPSAVRYAEYFYGMTKPFTILAVLCLLLYFSSINITHSKVINTIASCAFGVYLIHDNNFMRPLLWHTIFRNASFQDSPYLIPYSIAVILVIYVSCTLIELTRSKIFRALSSGRLS